MTMEDDDSLRMDVECGNCHAPLHFDVVHSLNFPRDGRLVVELLRAELNVFRCPVCGKTLSLQPPLLAFHEERREMVIAADDDELFEELRETARGQGQELTAVADYNALLDVVQEWADEYLNRGFAPAITGSEPERDEDGVELLHTPLSLLLMLAQSDGRILPRLLTDPPQTVEWQREFVGKLLAAAVVESVDRSFTYAFHHGGPQALLDRLPEAVPPECVTPAALERLVDRCLAWVPDLLKDPADVDRAWRYEYLNAAAHAVAGARNPRGREWAYAQLQLFSFSRSPNFEVPAPMLLNADVLGRTIRFDDAWDAGFMSGRSDREHLELLSDWFEHIGMEQRFAEELKAVPFQPDLSAFGADDDATVAQRVFKVILEATQKGDADFDAVDGICRVLLRSGRADAAEQLARMVLDHLAAEGELEQLGWTLKSMAELFNEVMASDVAASVLEAHATTVLNAAPPPPCRLYFSLVNELGNAHRLAGAPATALEAYGVVGEVIEVCPEATADDRATLERNRAIVLRELGRYDEAVRIFRGLLADIPAASVDAAHLNLSLARTFFELNLHDEALAYARTAAAVPLSAAHATLRVWILIAIAVARVAIEDRPDLVELDEALTTAATIDDVERMVAAAILHLAPRAAISPEAIAAAERIAREELHTYRGPVEWRFVTLVASLAEWRLVQGDEAEAAAILARLFDAAAGLDQLPWQVLWLKARMADPSDVEQRWTLVRAALARIDASVPEGTDAQLSSSWLSDKDPFQAFIVTTAQAALQADDATPADALQVSEFVNGRDVRPRTPRDTATPVAEVFVAAVPAAVRAFAVTFLESDDAIDVVLVPSTDGGATSFRLGVPTPHLRQAQSEFARQIGSRGLLPRHRRAAREAVAALLEDLGSMLAERVDAGAHLCLLPSATLLGLPLHAATSGGEPLLQRNPISYAPNVTVIAELLADGPLQAPDAGLAGLIAVDKDGDSADYAVRTDEAADRLRQLLSVDEVDLRGLAADKGACLNAFGAVDHLVLLAHGVEAGRLEGRGLCVSDGKTLPRAPLPVESAPQLRRFVIDAADLAEVKRLPAAVVSLACSSARAVRGAGGSRIGLDRSLLPNGTRALVAPLWDVDQESGLAFIEELHRRWVAEPALGPGEHVRAAQLAVREQYPELYHWAPFILQGSWI
jgi:CHAT domain-containing protein